MTNDLIGGAWDDIRPHVEDSLRNGDFAMIIDTNHVIDCRCEACLVLIEQVLAQYAPCGCRYCSEGDAMHCSGFIAISDADVAYVWHELQSVPSYVETQAARFAAPGLAQLVAEATDAPLIVLMEDEPRHTDDTPFCGDCDCPCHSDADLFEEFIARPVREGRLKTWEAQALLWPEQ